MPQGLKIFSAAGGAPSSDEVAAAFRVAATHQEMTFGTILQTDSVTGVTVEYHAHKKMALTTPGIGFDYRKCFLPNPTPGRSVRVAHTDDQALAVAEYLGPDFMHGNLNFYYLGELLTIDGDPNIPFTASTNFPYSSDASGFIDQLLTGSATQWVYDFVETTFGIVNGPQVVVIASDGEVLAKERINYDSSVYPRALYLANKAGVHSTQFEVPWSGAGKVWMFDADISSATPALRTLTFDHDLVFTVPPDCIYSNNLSNLAYPGNDGLDAEWDADWDAGQAARAARRQSWLIASSSAAIDNLKLGIVPASWETAIKAAAPDSDNVYRLNVLSVSYFDDVISDTSSGLTVAGTKITERTVSLSYSIDVPGVDGSVVTELREAEIVGTLTQVVTQHKKFSRDISMSSSMKHHSYSRTDTYSDWYVDNELDLEPSEKGVLMPYQFISDSVDGFTQGMGLFWSGSYTASGGHYPNAEFGDPQDYRIHTFIVPELPAYTNTLQGALPEFLLQYHADAKLKYRKTPIVSTPEIYWVSSMTDGTIVTVTPFGLVRGETDLGVFWDSIDAEGVFDDLVVYGSAQFHYVAATGEFIFDKWIPLMDANGNVVESRSIGMLGSEPAFNAVIKFGRLTWPDLVAEGKAHVADIAKGMAAETEDPETAAIYSAVINALKPA